MLAEESKETLFYGQEQWELDHLIQGQDKYLYRTAEHRRRGYIDITASGTYLLRRHLEELASELQIRATTDAGPRRMGAIRELVRMASMRPERGKLQENYLILAYIGLNTMLQCLYDRDEKMGYMTRLCGEIGKRIEQEQTLVKFKLEHPDLMTIRQERMSASHTKRIRKKIEHYQSLFKMKNLEWEPWGRKAVVEVGVFIMKCIMEMA